MHLDGPQLHAEIVLDIVVIPIVLPQIVDPVLAGSIRASWASVALALDGRADLR